MSSYLQPGSHLLSDAPAPEIGRQTVEQGAVHDEAVRSQLEPGGEQILVQSRVHIVLYTVEHVSVVLEHVDIAVAQRLLEQRKWLNVQ